jgi:DNA-binding winged helix-turn-helix (wHTH) protein
MDDHPDGHGKEKSPESADCRTDRSPVSHAGLRRRREEAGQAPIRLRYWGRNGYDGPFAEYADLSSIVLELPLSELAQLLPQRFAVKLYNLVQKLFDIPEGPCFPCSLADLVRDQSLLKSLRSKLAHVNHLSELIADPPAILIDERQKLFFYWGVPVLLRPVSFSYMLLLAKTPGELVMREIIYRCLWPGEINYEGTNKPYERQITDQKRKLLGDIRRGISDRMEVGDGELESLIATRSKVGYALNLDRKDVLVFHEEGLKMASLLVLFTMDRLFYDWFGWA